jgi:hypothetical protein
MSVQSASVAAVIVAVTVAVRRSRRDALLALLREVMDHRRLTNRYDEALILLPRDLVVRVEEALS